MKSGAELQLVKSSSLQPPSPEWVRNFVCVFCIVRHWHHSATPRESRKNKTTQQIASWVSNLNTEMKQRKKGRVQQVTPFAPTSGCCLIGVSKDTKAIQCHCFATVLILAEHLMDAVRFWSPCQARSSLPHRALCFLGLLPLHSGKSEGKGRKGKTNSHRYCTAQEAWSIYQVDWTNYFATLNSNLLDECCYSWQRKEAAELERGHFAHCSLSSRFVWLR